MQFQSRWGLCRARRTAALCLIAALATALTSGVQAQHESGYELPTYVGSPTGVDLNGQDGFYNPDPPNSVTALVYSYAANALQLPVNPTGGEQFVGATGPGSSIYARSQKDVPYGDGNGQWKISFDVAVKYVGVLPSADNIGSFSAQPLDVAAPTHAGFIALARWADPVVATNWNADYAYWIDDGTTFIIESVPDAGFQNLDVDHWYRWCTTVDFDTNLIIEVSITDLTSGVKSTANPVGWNLAGGAGGTLPAPTGFRYFGGTITQPGNVMAFDNLEIGPLLSCPWDLDGCGTVDAADLAILLGNWGNPYGPVELARLLGNWGPCS